MKVSEYITPVKCKLNNSHRLPAGKILIVIFHSGILAKNKNCRIFITKFPTIAYISRGCWLEHLPSGMLVLHMVGLGPQVCSVLLSN